MFDRTLSLLLFVVVVYLVGCSFFYNPSDIFCYSNSHIRHEELYDYLIRRILFWFWCFIWDVEIWFDGFPSTT